MKMMFAALALPLALAAGAAQAAEPSFRRSLADGAAETPIRADEELAALERELDRLRRLASERLDLDPAHSSTRGAVERGWIRSRSDCRDAPDPRACIRDETVARIHALRRDRPAARADDEAGLSLGPFSADCAGPGPLRVTFVNSDPGAAALEWGGRTTVLPRAISASGARYVGTAAGADLELWIKGDEARISTPQGAWTCRLAPPA